MDTIYVDHGYLSEAASNLAAHKRTFDEVLSGLESDLAPMINTWSGEARDLYLQKKAAWDRAAKDLSDLLAHISTLTEAAYTGYCQAVTDVYATWS
jgi:early secretory antigenic target protein ESAT-6